jgi:hypothetical protein
LYSPILDGTVPFMVTDMATAELIKTAANAFLATKIGFINAIAELCEAADADVTILADALGCDNRIGRRFLNAGLGFGGGCLPKYIRALVARAEELGVGHAFTFLREVDNANMRQRRRIVNSSFIHQALQRAPLTVFGDGNQTRSLCYVDDLVRGIVAMLDSDEPGPINLGNPNEMSVRQIAELVRELVGSTSEIELHPLPQDDPTRRRPDIAKARELLGWTPEVTVRVGIARTIEWHASHFHANLASCDPSSAPRIGLALQTRFAAGVKA